MAEGYPNSYIWPTMNWQASDLDKEWERFYQHCEFAFGGPLSKCTEKEKICNLMSFVGDKGREMYLTFQWNNVTVGDGETSQEVSEKDLLERVAAKFKEQLASKKNPIMAAVQFDRRRQKQGETFDNFVTDLKLLARGLDVNETNKLIRNAIACKSLDERVKQRCLEKSKNLTLETAVNIGRLFEATKDGMQVIAGEDPYVSVHGVSTKGNESHRRKNQWKPPTSKSTEREVAGHTKCQRCGYNSHKPHEKCAAKNQSCRKCGRIGHFGRVCRSKGKKVHGMEEEPYSSEETDNSDDDVDQYAKDMHLLHLKSLKFHKVDKESDQQQDEEWWETVQVGRGTLHCQLDTGAQASVLTTKQLRSIAPEARIKKTHKRLVSYSQHQIMPRGCTTLKVKHKDKVIKVKFFIIDKPQNPILSGKVCKALNLVKRIHEIDQCLKELLIQHPDLESATGAMPGTHSIKIDPTVSPVVHGPRRQPAALLPKITSKLREMEKEGHLAKVTQPTDWVNSMVVARKRDKIRICLDPSDLNKAVKREHYPIPTVEEIATKIPEAKVFSVLDAKSGYLQMKIDYESSLLTTMNTPLGRYRWLKLPFGIKSAPEMYQRAMDEMLEGIEDAHAMMDDILVAGRDIPHHDAVLRQVLDRAKSYNLKLNFDKVKIRKEEVRYVGHIMSASGLKPDPEKVEAMKSLPAPENKEDVRRFLGSVQYLAKFLPQLAEEEDPLRHLTKKDTIFHWDKPQEKAFQRIKDLCCTAPILAYYDVSKRVTIQCDASKKAVGAVLLQEGKPIAYASRKLRASELNWSTIEKEMLAIVFSTTKFREYILGKETVVQTDHKPLETILRKPLQSAPLRLQTMMLKVKGYDLKVEYLPGKKQVIADTLSRASLNEVPPEREEFQVNMLERISVTQAKYQELQQTTANELHELYVIIQRGWPDTKQQVPHSIKAYWGYRDELAVLDGVIYRGMRIVVPPSMQQEMLELVHEAHLGIVKCKQRAREALYWPGMNSQVEEKVKGCTVCHDYAAAQHREPMMPSKTPDYPWAEAASDIFTFQSKNYVLSVDYYSKYIEVTELDDLSACNTIEALKGHFGRHGMPEKLTTDCGTQYTSAEFKNFAKAFNFQHVLISPKHPNANGEAEAAVKIVKSLWRKNSDKHKALLVYRATPIPGIDLSPSQLCMGRRLRTSLPIAHSLLEPEAHNTNDVKRRMRRVKEKQTYYYNRDGKKELAPLKPGDPVRIRPEPGSKLWKKATVVDHHPSPRSYIVDTGNRMLRRNRVALRSDPGRSNAEKDENSDIPTTEDADHLLVTQTPPQKNVSTPPAQDVKEPRLNNKQPFIQESSTMKDNQTSRTQVSATEEHYITRSGRVSRKPCKLSI